MARKEVKINDIKSKDYPDVINNKYNIDISGIIKNMNLFIVEHKKLRKEIILYNKPKNLQEQIIFNNAILTIDSSLLLGALKIIHPDFQDLLLKICRMKLENPDIEDSELSRIVVDAIKRKFKINQKPESYFG